MTDADILSRFKPGQRYTIAQIAKKHGHSSLTMQYWLSKMVSAGTLQSERRGKATHYYVAHAHTPVAVAGLPAMKPYRLPQVMLDQAARCADARKIDSRFN